MSRDLNNSEGACILAFELWTKIMWKIIETLAWLAAPFDFVLLFFFFLLLLAEQNK